MTWLLTFDPWIAPGRIPTFGDGRPRCDQFVETYETHAAERRRIFGAGLETYEEDARSHESYDGSDQAGYCGVGPDRLCRDRNGEVF